MERTKKYYPSLGQSLALLLILVLLSFIFTVLVMFLERSPGRTGATIPKALKDILLYIIPMALTCWIALRQKKTQGDTEPLLFSKVSFITLLLLLAGTICLSTLIDLVIYSLPMPGSGYLEKLIKEMIDNATAMHPLMAVLAVSILPAVFEELLFRGIILQGFLKRYDPWKAILLSSLLFGLFHMNPWQFVAGLGAGIFLGWVYYKTHSLWACMFIHAINNLGALIGYWLTNDINFWLYDRMGKQSFILFFITTILALVICIQLLKRQFGKKSVNAAP